LTDEIVGWRDAGLDVVVSLLTPAEDFELGLSDEARIVRQEGLTFINFPISDYGVPTSKGQTQRLVRELEERLSHGSCIGIHCRQGIGRSSLVAACVLVTTGESSETAFQQIQNARGSKVPDTAEQKEWVASFASNLERDLDTVRTTSR
jgi:protein-tyrosine phosphatase